MTDEMPLAHPTDYNGIRFRSKCEAIFYRNLELGGWLVEYEPKQWLADGWSFDFLAVRKDECGGLLLLLIEYKPSKPTAAYMERHLSRIRSLGGKISGFENVVAYVSAFGPPGHWASMAYEFWEEMDGAKRSGWVDIESTIGLFDWIAEAAKHRYDLL